MARPQSNTPAGSGALAGRLSAALQGLSPREQRAVRAAAWVVGLGLLWWVALAPAIATLRQAGARHAALDQALSRMQAAAASAEVLRTQNATPPPAREVAVRAIDEATQALGTGAQMTLQGDRASVALREIAPAALAQWLQQLRINARVLPVQVQLQRGPSGWSGQVVLAGPGLGTGN